MAIPLKYNVRSLARRPVATVLTIGSVALVVAVVVAMLGLADGLRTALVASGDPRNVMLRRLGSDSEQSSSVSREAFRSARLAPGVATDGGTPLASAEIVVVVNLRRRNQQEGANVTVRGLSSEGRRLHPQVTLTEGRMFEPGLREVVVSRSIHDRFAGTSLGDRLRLGHREWLVTGVFVAGATAFGSEIWTDVEQLADDFNRDSYSTVLVRAADAGGARRLAEWAERERRFGLIAVPETEYYRELTPAARPFQLLSLFVALVMGAGVCFAAVNAMEASVTYRAREIATLLVLGYRRGQVLTAFLTESVLVAMAGGVLGCLAVWPMDGLGTGTVNWRTLSEVTFELDITARALAIGLAFAAAIGAAGGMMPAWRASRKPPSLATRDS